MIPELLLMNTAEQNASPGWAALGLQSCLALAAGLWTCNDCAVRWVPTGPGQTRA